MKQVVIRLQLVELNDHDTNVIPDEKEIYSGEKIVHPEIGYEYDLVDSMQMEADASFHRYYSAECERLNHEDEYGQSLIEYEGVMGYCSRCDAEFDRPEVDYDSEAKYQDINRGA